MEGKMCLNPSCSAPELISLVPHEPEINREIISDPHILKEPLLVNGYTSVFNVSGKSDDNTEASINFNKTQIKYQILQNTHVHVTNTVIIDTEKDILRKIEDNDPTTLKKLLDSQRMSAAKRLNTFIESVSKTVKSARKSTTKQNINLNHHDPKPLLSTHKRLKITQPITNPTNLPKIQFIPAKSSVITPQVSNESLVTSAAHPSLKITSVTSMNEASVPQLQKVQPVAIQAAPVPVVPQLPLSPNSAPLPLISSVQSVGQPVIRAPMFTEQEKSEFQKMREEITELKELLKQIGGNVRKHDT
ncbi:uncharacterized protein LOC129618439 [Condylostylus longicornis]|uniref:uncharacterized protein LOC129618439 n=1 Tax=Condylostylus longicornis TaxID=2530218 RepID=UPI00244DA51B|nr:uncharacterized protein LOC129618439 [Condylostylus longicornis]